MILQRSNIFQFNETVFKSMSLVSLGETRNSAIYYVRKSHVKIGNSHN